MWPERQATLWDAMRRKPSTCGAAPFRPGGRCDARRDFGREPRPARARARPERCWWLGSAMRMTAEIRGFWAGHPPPSFAAWFRAAGPSWGGASDSKSRIDEYLRDPAQTTLGIKRRGGSQGVE